MSAEQTGRPTEQEWAEALEKHYWISERWACYCDWFPSPLGQQPAVAFWLHVVDEIAPLIDREREAARAEGMADVIEALASLKAQWQAEALRDGAALIFDTFANPDRRRPVSGSAATDFANDEEWARIVLLDEADRITEARP